MDIFKKLLYPEKMYSQNRTLNATKENEERLEEEYAAREAAREATRKQKEANNAAAATKAHNSLGPFFTEKEEEADQELERKRRAANAKAADQLLVQEINEIREVILQPYDTLEKIYKNNIKPVKIGTLKNALTEFNESKKKEQANMKKLNKLINNSVFYDPQIKGAQQVEQGKFSATQLEKQKNSDVIQTTIHKLEAALNKLQKKETIKKYNRKYNTIENNINQKNITNYLKSLQNNITEKGNKFAKNKITAYKEARARAAEQAQMAAENAAAATRRNEEKKTQNISSKFVSNIITKAARNAASVQQQANLAAAAAKRMEEESAAKAAEDAASIAAEEGAAAVAAEGTSLQAIIRDQLARNTNLSENNLLAGIYVQTYIFAIISAIHNAIYNDEKIIKKIQNGLADDVNSVYVIRSFNNEKSIKEHLYRFFIKGSGALTLLLSKEHLSKEKERIPFSNDIDTILLINPNLTEYMYNVLQANLTHVICNIVQEYLLKTDIPNTIFGDKNTETSWSTMMAYMESMDRDIKTKYTTMEERKQDMLPPLIEQYTMEGSKFKPSTELPDKLNDVYTSVMWDPFNTQSYINRYHTLSTQIAQLSEDIGQLNYMIPIQQTYIDNYNARPEHLKNPSELRLYITIIKKNRAQLAQYNERLAALQPELESLQSKLQEIKLNTIMRPLNYKIAFNKGYIIKEDAPRNASLPSYIEPNVAKVVTDVHYLDETVITILPRFDYANSIKPDRPHKVRLSEFCDIVIPFKTNPSISAYWKYYSVNHFDIPIKNIKFDVASAPYLLYDQDVTTKGTPQDKSGTAAKHRQRAARRHTLQAYVRQLLTARNKNTSAIVTDLKTKMPAELFAELYPIVKGGRRSKTRHHRHSKKVKLTRRLSSKRGRK